MANYLVPRHKVLAFYGVPSTGMAGVTYRRMQFFTELSMNKNPVEHNRKYVDEATERSDVIAYAPSIGYGFDRHRNNEVLKDIIGVSDKELVAENAIREIIWVDISDANAVAIKRDYAVIPDAEGDDGNVYTHSGNFKANGEPVFGKASSTDGWMTITFTENES